MQCTLLKAKLHRACVTHAQLDYEGSCAIDGELLNLSGIHDYEQIQIYNLNNGERLTTYAIRAEDGSYPSMAPPPIRPVREIALLFARMRCLANRK